MTPIIRIAAAIAATLALSAPAAAQSASAGGQPQFVTYGIGAHPQEGDPDKRQAFYFSVPAHYDRPLYIRLFDPESGGQFDQITTRGPNTTTRFTVFGGKGADTNRFARPERISHQEETIGTRLLQREFRAEPEFDNAWMTLGSVRPDQGDLVDDRYVFRLLVHGLRGHDGNVFDFAISTSETENIQPEDLRLYTYGPTTRLPVDNMVSELRFRIPEGTERFTVGTFDGASAETLLTQPFASHPLAASGQNNWETTTLPVAPHEYGTYAAVTLQGGDEVPNDATFYVVDQAGKLIPFELPVRLLEPRPRPVARGTVAADPQSCMGALFADAGSSDPSNGTLSFRWRFGDGKSANGAKASHQYETEGRFTAWLEVSHDSPRVGNGATVPLPVYVKRAPIARSTARAVVAVGEETEFDGRASSASSWEIVRHEWRISDGTVLTGPVAQHTFKAPGTYRIVHTVEDDSGHRCNTHTEEFSIRVNAPPVAVAGPNQHLTASVVRFDGSKSHDPDGDKIIRYDWDFGDGNTGSGVQPSHVYAEPGVYEVRLTVTDSAGVVRNTGSDTLRVIVNARPIADAGPEQVGAPGQQIIFDGSRTVDPDGKIVDYRWDFRDGTTATGPVVNHAFKQPGIYQVRLQVQDDTKHEEAVDFIETRVFINHPPVADAGPQLTAAPGDEVKLSGARSFDRDGKIATYRWDFSDTSEPTFGETVARRFERPGIYVAKLTVTDDSGAINASTSAETRIAINHQPVAHADNVETNQLTVIFDGTKSVDADGDSLTYAWEFGDGNKGVGARVTHTYKEGGTYKASLTVSDGKGLHNSSNRSEIAVRIDRAPVAIAGENRIACTDEAIQFDGAKSSDPEGGVLRYLWDFGDGTTSEAVNPTKIYRRGGHYPVKLTVRDDSGMEQNVHSDRIAVQVDQGPIANISPRQILACTNTEVVFDGAKSTDVDGVVNSYRWDFGDGNFGGGVKPTHIYEKPGNYRAFLTIRGEKVGQCSDTSQDEIPVQIIQGPLAIIGAPAAAPVGTEVAFDGSGSRFGNGKITGWRWDFGDGSTANGVKVSHKYAKAGIYRVTLTVTSDSDQPSCRAVSSRHVLAVNAAPVASIAAKPLAAVGEDVLFDASASRDPDGSLVGYVWDFGDGTKAEGVTVRHRFRASGNYRVKLTVEDNAALPNSKSATEFAVRINAAPVAHAGEARVGAPGQTLTFDGSKSTDSDGSITEYFWSFGDGKTATGKAVTNTYAKPGVYTVRLRVKDDSGHAAAYGFHEVPVVINHPPVANAGPAISAGPNDEVKLSGARSFDPDGKIMAWRWEFSDDAAPLTGSDVSRRFDKPGIYTAKLTVTDDSGAINASTSAETRIAINHAPVAIAGENVETNQLTISFDGGKSSDADGDTLLYSWDFGDGNKATGVRAIHTFKEGGIYPVVLTVNDGRGLHNSESQHGITVRIDRAPIAVAGENRTVCTGDTIVFDGGQSKDPEGGVLRYVWDFGDGTKSEIVNPTKSYRKGGHYPITLTVRDDSGMEGNAHTDRIAVQVDQGPIATIAPREVLACAGAEVSFDGSKSTDVDGVVNSFRWDFGDGNFANGERATHIYEKPGNYRAFLTIQGEKVGQCSASSTDEIPVRIAAGPVAAIKAPSSVPLGQPVSFDGAGSRFEGGKVTGWKWDFGDGNGANGANATHKYAKAGVYRVTLTVTSNSDQPSCRAVSSRHIVTVNDAPLPAFAMKQLVATGEEVVFDATASRDPDGSIVSYEWDFGDGNKGSGVTARHKYAAPGAYKVKLTVQDNMGLPNSTVAAEQTVRVNAPPEPQISGPAVACVNEAVNWTSDRSRDPDGKIRSFRWTFGDGNEAATPAASHQYRAPGRYSLTLRADDGAGLANSQGQVTQTIWVNQPPRAVPGPDRLVCPGEPVKFDASASSDPDGKLTRYLWDFGDGTTLEGEQIEHRFAKPGTYQVRLTVTDDAGSSCSSNTASVRVLVKAPPVARSGGDREVWVGGANDAILLDGSRSIDPDGRALSFAWQIGDAGSAAGERVRHVIAAPGEYKASLTVSDPSGLSCGTATENFRIIARERK